MPKQIIRVKRSGIGVGDRKNVPAFRAWLNSQARTGLTYRKDIERKDEIGWTAPDFTLEALNRGVEVKFGTTLSWARGHQPRTLGLDAIRKAFPSIQF